MCDPKAHEARLAALERDMEDVKHALFTGNGKASLIERVTKIERGMDTQTWLLRLIFGGMLLSVGGQLIALIRGG